MGEVVNLSVKALTPRQMLEKALEIESTHAYLILVLPDGSFDLRASGDLEKLPGAALQMQHYATKFIRGEIEGE